MDTPLAGEQQGLVIRRLAPGEAALEIIAGWRYAEWFAPWGWSLDAVQRQLDDLVQRQGYETALIAEMAGEPAGTCLMVRQEIEQKHEVSPWLAGLYVAPEYRRRGIASALIRAIEAHAKAQGVSRLYLYTSVAEALYAKLGWEVLDRFNDNEEDMVFMGRGS